MFVKEKVAVVNYVGFDFAISIAREFLNNGLKAICLLDKNSIKGRKLIKILEKEFGKDRAMFIMINFSNEPEIEDAFKKTVEAFGNIDIVINSGGLSNEYDINPEADINSNQITTPCINTLMTVEKYLSKYKSTEEGVIMNISSICDIDRFSDNISSSQYFSSALHHREIGVKVITICPKQFDTTNSCLNIAKKVLSSESYQDMLQKLWRKLYCERAHLIAKAITSILEELQTNDT